MPPTSLSPTPPSSEGPTGAGAVFDHIAIAVAHLTDPWPVLAGCLGARYHDGGVNPGFGWNQLRFANGFVVEGLHPERVDENDFLARFLAQRGPGPHHLTFKVPDLEVAIARCRETGIEPVAIDLHDPNWREAFLHPRDAYGIVVQLAESAASTGIVDPPDGFPELPVGGQVAALTRVVHAVADLDGALGLFRDLLGGRVVARGAAVDGNHWVELAWAGPGRLRLLEGAHAEIAEWIGDAPGRLRHLHLAFDEPACIPGAEQVAVGRWVVSANGPLGTRLVIQGTAR